VKRIASRTPAWVTISVGGAMGIAGYWVAALDQHAVAILAASVLTGGLYSIFHSTMQVWATDISPEARGTAAALFVTAAFLGGAFGTGLGAFFALGNQFSALLVVAASLFYTDVITIATPM